PPRVARYGARMIDLRTDTITQPTPAMRRAIAEAVVGDEQKREDPTVTALEERGAALLGQEEAVFVPPATLAHALAGPGGAGLLPARDHGEPDRAARADGAGGRGDRRGRSAHLPL